MTPLVDIEGIGTREDYMIDNIAYIIISYIFLLVFEKIQDLQTSTIDNQNVELLAKQEALIKSNELLQNRSEQLVSSNEELERFAYIASHDLKTPLNNIISFCGLLEKELKQNHNKKAIQYFDFIKQGSNRMDVLIKDLLEYSKMSGNEIKNEEIDLNKLVHSIVDSISVYLKQRNAKVIIENRLPSIKANRAKVYLLFKNLIENGVKYNQSPHPRIKITFIIKENIYQFYIKDNGIGIAAKYHENIFQMFSRLHTSKEYEGTGLGLALCKKIVDGLKGQIQLESERGVGSTFIITFDKKLFNEVSSQENTPKSKSVLMIDK